MGDPQKSEPFSEDPLKSQSDTKIEIELASTLAQEPSYYQSQPQPQYYQQPQYQQQPQYYQVGGQNVYYVSPYPPEPTNVSRHQPAYRQNYPNQPDQFANFEGDDVFMNAFSTIKIRNNFVQKVYTILSCQLFFTFGILLIITFLPGVKIAILKNGMGIIVGFSLGYLFTSIALICCGDLRRQFPTNFILLAILTICMTGMLSVSVAIAEPIIVLAAVGTTALVCTIVSIFACQTKYDVTGCGMCLCICTLVILIYGLILFILMLCGIYIKVLHMIYSALACLLFCGWLMYDTQMVVGGRRIELSTEEYILGALVLYMDIMIIFMHILSLFENCSRG